MIFKLGELFCGPGGLALGAGLTAPLYSENGENFSISHVNRQVKNLLWIRAITENTRIMNYSI